jgi:hypothetical protein
LGLIAPFIITGKIMFQMPLILDSGWDEKVSDEIADKYMIWRAQIIELESIKISRCLFASQDKSPERMFLACFGDTSGLAYGDAIYLVKSFRETMQLQLVFSKSRVTPKEMIDGKVKEEMMVRLELMAAEITARLGSYVKNALKVQEAYFFTVSLIMLARLKRTVGKCG